MLNKLQAFIRAHSMISPGDTVICAVSGGADSIGLLFALYLLREKLGFRLEAAHFNHHLRGAESDRDEAFVKDFCRGYEIPLHLGGGQILPGAKGLEAAAREARYGFLRSLPGKIATAHTANDNAETVLLHLIRGTGLKGLGGITPVSPGLIRPMLTVTRPELMDFLQEYGLSWVEDSSNGTDQFLRNRVRHGILPLLEQENPKCVENTSAMALRLREDEAALSLPPEEPVTVTGLRQLEPARRSRALGALLEQWGVKEPASAHIALLERLVLSPNPSARASFPGGVTVLRNYDTLEAAVHIPEVPETYLNCPGVTELPALGLRIRCEAGEAFVNEKHRFCLPVSGGLLLRSRAAGDTIRLPGGTKSLKKLFIDRKIPARLRQSIPVVADDMGLLAVYGIGANLDRRDAPGTWISITVELTESSPLL